MNSKLVITTQVLPGNKIEIQSNQLIEGETVEVSITLTRKKINQTLSFLDFIEQSHKRHPKLTKQEVESQIQEERDSWDN